MTLTRNRIFATTASLVAAGGLLLATAPAALADDEKEKDGDCSMKSDWELELEKDDGKIEIEFDVDTPRSGQTWRVRVLHNGDLSYKGKRVTDDDGEYEVDRKVRDRAGKDRIVVRGVNAKTGEVCRGALSI
jgi:hypothetical protein